jgi:uncharacterized membrane protein
MDTLLALLDRQPLVFVHLVSAVAALLIGAVVLARRKGTGAHRALGWAWVAAMGTATASSAFLHDPQAIPGLGGFSPIHLFTAYVAVALPRAVWQARRGSIVAHRQTMRGIYIGGCVVAGLFTLLPGRVLGSMLWGALGVV